MSVSLFNEIPQTALWCTVRDDGVARTRGTRGSLLPNREAVRHHIRERLSCSELAVVECPLWVGTRDPVSREKVRDEVDERLHEIQ